MTAKMVKEALVVPTPAIYKNSEGADYVLLAGSDEKAHQKTVRLGIRNSDLTQIASGINPGDPVITVGGYAVPDGTQIKIEKPAADEKEATVKDATDTGKDEKADQATDAKQRGKTQEKAASAKKTPAKGKE